MSMYGWVSHQEDQFVKFFISIKGEFPNYASSCFINN